METDKATYLKEMNKLDKILKLVDKVDLYPPMIWLYTWSEIDDFIRNNSDYAPLASREDIFMALVEDEVSFSLEGGSEAHYEDVKDWLLSAGLMKDILDEDDDE